MLGLARLLRGLSNTPSTDALPDDHPRGELGMVPPMGQPVAVVTGATRGIGRAIAKRLAQDGYQVVALGRAEPELKSLEQEQPGVRGLRCDVRSVEDVQSVCAQVLGELGAPKVLVNNAGIALSAPLGKTSLEDFQAVMEINARAPFLFCQLLMPEMAKAGGGRVINIASTAGLKGFKYTSAYCASKHALIGMTKSLALEFARKQVTVNAVCPGWTETSMLDRAADAISRTTGRTDQQAKQTLADMNPMGRVIQPDEVAALCAFLASPAAAAVTGASYAIDAGEVV